MRTDRQTDITTLSGAFCGYANVPKNEIERLSTEQSSSQHLTEGATTTNRVLSVGHLRAVKRFTGPTELPVRTRLYTAQSDVALRNDTKTYTSTSIRKYSYCQLLRYDAVQSGRRIKIF